MRFFITLCVTCLITSQAAAFCGFYVAQEDGPLFNEGSKVVFARDGNRSTITMSSDYRGAASDFAMIVPTPSVLLERNIRTVRPATITHLENYTAPRIVEYYDHAYCDTDGTETGGLAPEVFESPVVIADAPAQRGPRALGVRIEAEYAVGAYDIQILSARQSDGLVTYLRQENYQIPDGAEATLADYIAMGMKFFVARVNLDRHSASDTKELEPLQITFRSRNFMLPLQLGKVNSAGQQDMLMLMLARQGRVQVENYPMQRMPSNFDVPIFVGKVFNDFYRQMFRRTAPDNTVMIEYAWDMGWCDPCADDPLDLHELRELGAVWVRDSKQNPSEDVFVTRMHIQYSKDTFQDDLVFSITDDTENFQSRYVMQQPVQELPNCPVTQYISDKKQAMLTENDRLHQLTGWTRASINQRVQQTIPDYLR